MKTPNLAWILLSMIGTAVSCAAGLKLPSIFSDHLVLQRDIEVPVWGKADPDGVFHPADARVTGKDTVQVQCQEVTEPVEIRYGWADNPRVNLYDRQGLPATPFRAAVR